MPPSIHRTSSINSTPAVTATGARRASGPGGVLSADVARVASARRHTMPEIGARRGVDGDRAAPAPRESFRRRLETVSSRAPTPPPEADSRAANARTTGAADGAGATGAAAGPSHGATSLDAARAYLAELAGDRGGALTTLVAQLNGHDRRALDHLALTVHALHLSVDDASHAKTFAGIGDALASFLAAAARANAKPGSTPRDLCVEGNKGYRKLCECVGALLRSDGIANALFGRARERGDAAADTLVSERLGGRMDGHVRTNGMVNRHGGDAQRRMADAAQRFALGARHATNLVDMVGSALELLGRTDQLLNDVSLKRPAAEPGGPRAPGGGPAAPAGPAS
ncbi:type 3 secretion system effector BapA, partial [Burkholderia pseudomallei]|nr:type 3 secretion system effector BapA [Burkholderia pseudomallei]